MVDAPFIPARGVETERRPAAGYAMVLAAAVLFAVNGTVSKVILASGVSSLRLAQVRSTGAALGLGIVLALAGPAVLRTTRRELPRLVLFGICGVGLVQLFYFLAIHRLKISIALLLQYLAPLLVALWARFVAKEPVRRRIWVALAFALAGLTVIVELWHGLALSGAGVGFGLLAALSFTAYFLLAERSVGERDPVSLTWYGFVFAALLWAFVQPWWSFPGHVVGRDVSLHGHLAGQHLPVWALMLWMVVPGTIVPFGLVVGALRHIPATRVGIVAMFEPVVATVVAWAWLGETLGTAQLIGGAVVLTGIVLAQTAR